VCSRSRSGLFVPAADLPRRAIGSITTSTFELALRLLPLLFLIVVPLVPIGLDARCRRRTMFIRRFAHPMARGPYKRAAVCDAVAFDTTG
jgi:hypothetical protein